MTNGCSIWRIKKAWYNCGQQQVCAETSCTRCIAKCLCLLLIRESPLGKTRSQFTVTSTAQSGHRVFNFVVSTGNSFFRQDKFNMPKLVSFILFLFWCDSKAHVENLCLLVCRNEACPCLVHADMQTERKSTIFKLEGDLLHANKSLSCCCVCFPWDHNHFEMWIVFNKVGICVVSVHRGPSVSTGTSFVHTVGLPTMQSWATGKKLLPTAKFMLAGNQLGAT